MHAYRHLRSQGSSVSPEEVAASAGVQKRHRVPYASLVAGLIVAAELPVADLARLQKAAATQKVRTEQGVERKKRNSADKKKGDQIDRRKKYREEKVTPKFVQKVADAKKARAAAKVAKHLSLTSPVFMNLIETERTALSARSRKLFTLSALHFATLELMSDKQLEDFPSASQKCQEFWEGVGQHIPEWKYVKESKMTAGEVRRDFIHCHAIVLQALGRAGRALYAAHPQEVQKRLKNLRQIDWSRRNAQLWEGRAMLGGAMSKSGQNITLTSNEIKRVLGLTLSSEEQAAETTHMSVRQVKTTAKTK